MKMEWPDAYCAKKGWTPERYRRKTKRNSNGQQKGERNRGKNKNETQRERERDRETETETETDRQTDRQTENTQNEEHVNFKYVIHGTAIYHCTSSEQTTTNT